MSATTIAQLESTTGIPLTAVEKQNVRAKFSCDGSVGGASAEVGASSVGTIRDCFAAINALPAWGSFCSLIQTGAATSSAACPSYTDVDSMGDAELRAFVNALAKPLPAFIEDSCHRVVGMLYADADAGTDTATATSSDANECTDRPIPPATDLRVASAACAFGKARGMCEAMPAEAKLYCPQTCGICGNFGGSTQASASTGLWAAASLWGSGKTNMDLTTLSQSVLPLMRKQMREGGLRAFLGGRRRSSPPAPSPSPAPTPGSGLWSNNELWAQSQPQQPTVAGERLTVCTGAVVGSGAQAVLASALQSDCGAGRAAAMATVATATASALASRLHALLPTLAAPAECRAKLIARCDALLPPPQPAQPQPAQDSDSLWMGVFEARANAGGAEQEDFDVAIQGKGSKPAPVPAPAPTYSDQVDPSDPCKDECPIDPVTVGGKASWCGRDGNPHQFSCPAGQTPFGRVPWRGGRNLVCICGKDLAEAKQRGVFGDGVCEGPRKKVCIQTEANCQDACGIACGQCRRDQATKNEATKIGVAVVVVVVVLVIVASCYHEDSTTLVPGAAEPGAAQSAGGGLLARAVTVRMRDLRAGDEVLVADERTGEVRVDRISINLHTKPSTSNPDASGLTLRYGSSDEEGGVLRLTHDHVLLLADGSPTPARAARVGDRVVVATVAAGGGGVTISTITEIERWYGAGIINPLTHSGRILAGSAVSTASRASASFVASTAVVDSPKHVQWTLAAMPSLLKAGSLMFPARFQESPVVEDAILFVCGATSRMQSWLQGGLLRGASGGVLESLAWVLSLLLFLLLDLLVGSTFIVTSLLCNPLVGQQFAQVTGAAVLVTMVKHHHPQKRKQA
jgi:hypothetical protein